MCGQRICQSYPKLRGIDVARRNLKPSEPLGRSEGGSLRLIARLLLCLLVSCDGDRPKTRHESPVPLDVNALLDEGVCFTGQPIKELHCLPGKNKFCKTVGCSTKPEPISDICKQLRSEYASSGRVQLGVFAIVRHNHDPIISDKGDWWPTQEVGRIKLREVCYEGIELQTTSSRILESVRKQSSEE